MGEVTVLPLVGPRTAPAGLTESIDDLERRLEAVLAPGTRALVLDMEAVVRVSSTTVALLLWTRRRCAAHGVRVVLRHPSRRCRDQLARTGLLEVVPIEPPDAALRGRLSPAR